MVEAMGEVYRQLRLQGWADVQDIATRRRMKLTSAAKADRLPTAAP